MNHNLSPQQLPGCIYPKASDIKDHGVYQLPLTLRSIDWTAIKKYRGKMFKSVPLIQLTNRQILEMARMIARSFTENEPMKRHLHPPSLKPKMLLDKIHRDPFGNDSFGEWTSENILFWFIRLIILTSPYGPMENIQVNTDSVELSVTILDENNRVIGGAFNSSLKSEDTPFRTGDPFLDAVILAEKPILELIFTQEHEAIEALKNRYFDFREALENDKVGLHFMIARSPALPKEETFELVAASAEIMQHQGYRYVLVTASNQWTGAACEALNGRRVHFSPYRHIKRVPLKENATTTEPYSSDGYISAKDSGAMFYIIKLS